MKKLVITLLMIAFIAGFIYLWYTGMITEISDWFISAFRKIMIF